eukprot:sb/3472393/
MPEPRLSKYNTAIGKANGAFESYKVNYGILKQRGLIIEMSSVWRSHTVSGDSKTFRTELIHTRLVCTTPNQKNGALSSQTCALRSTSRTNNSPLIFYRGMANVSGQHYSYTYTPGLQPAAYSTSPTGPLDVVQSDPDLVPPDLGTPRFSDRINFPRYRKLTTCPPI